MSLRLALIRQRYNPFGGAERFVERALGALVADGAAVTLITRSWAGADRNGFSELICDPAYSRLLGGRAARDRSFSTAVQGLLAKGGYDITQSHERIPGCMIFRAGDGVHAAWLQHRAQVLGPLGQWGQRLSGYHRYVLGAERAMFAHPALRTVICNSRMVADELRSFYDLPEARISVIYNGVDGAVFHPGLADEFRAATRAAAGIPAAAPLLLYVGSGFERKGVPALLQAFARADREAHLVIVGADRHLRRMQQRAGQMGLDGRVHFTGPLQDVRPWYGAADGFVLPTLYDPCPNAALEALACGLPVVTSTACGARELITPGVNGQLAAALDVEQLASGLDWLIARSGEAGARAAAREAVASLSLPAMAEQLIALYHRLR